MSFTLAIVGRPNVGKSTLFNRLVGKKLALVDDRPGVTRDRREGEAHLGDLTFRIVDTAGLEEASAASLEGRMRAQTEAAIGDADAILFLIDARVGLTPTDRALPSSSIRSIALQASWRFPRGQCTRYRSTWSSPSASRLRSQAASASRKPLSVCHSLVVTNTSSRGRPLSLIA